MFNDIFGKNAFPPWNIPACNAPIPLLLVIHHISALYQLLCVQTHARHQVEQFFRQNSCKEYIDLHLKGLTHHFFQSIDQETVPPPPPPPFFLVVLFSHIWALDKLMISEDRSTLQLQGQP